MLNVHSDNLLKCLRFRLPFNHLSICDISPQPAAISLAIRSHSARQAQLFYYNLHLLSIFNVEPLALWQPVGNFTLPIDEDEVEEAETTFILISKANSRKNNQNQFWIMCDLQLQQISIPISIPIPKGWPMARKN